MAINSPKTWVAGTVLTASDLNTYLRDNQNTILTCLNDSGRIEFENADELTISSAAITVVKNFYRVDTESDASSDTLSTITLGTDVGEGFVLVLRLENTAREVVLDSGGTNIDIPSDFTMNANNPVVMMIYDGTNWRMISGGGAGAPAPTILHAAALSLPDSGYCSILRANETQVAVMEASFADGSTEEGSFCFVAPDDVATTCTIEFFWKAAVAGGNGRWQFDGEVVDDGDASDFATWGETVVADYAADGTSEDLTKSTSATFTWASDPSGQLCYLNVTRAGGHANDTLGVAAALRYVRIVWQAA